jgi:hypothetical protein
MAVPVIAVGETRKPVSDTAILFGSAVLFIVILALAYRVIFALSASSVIFRRGATAGNDRGLINSG